MEAKKLLKLLLKINYKTLFLNFKYLPFKQAIKFPILVSRRCVILPGKGKIFIKGHIIPGMITIGYGKIAIFDRVKSRSIVQIGGIIEFAGKANIGHGSKLDIAQNGILKLGNDLVITAETTIICYKNITIGSNCLLSWDILIMDTDLHKIKNNTGAIINDPQPIIIGDNVWIGCRCLILKGTTIGTGNVIAANSTLTKSYLKENCVLTGDKILKGDITWNV